MQRERRRNLLKLMALAGGVLAFAPYGPFISFLPSQFSVPGGERQQIFALKLEGRAARIVGQPFPVRVDEFERLPPNSRAIFVYPRTGDARRDSEPFKNWQLIRLPKELGGDRPTPESFRAFSQVCVHLWCLWDYKPHVWAEKPPGSFRGVPEGQCPCHGSVYNALTGVAIAGPASFQAPPANALAQLTLGVDAKGFLVVEPPKFTLADNGVIGFGRFVRR